MNLKQKVLHFNSISPKIVNEVYKQYNVRLTKISGLQKAYIHIEQPTAM